MARQAVVIPATFKIVLLIVTGLTLLSFLGLAALAFFGNQGVDEAHVGMFQKAFFSACSFGWQAGIGAILG